MDSHPLGFFFLYPFMQGKKSFLLYCDMIYSFEALTDEQAGKLIKIVFEYVNDRDPVIEDQLLNFAFTTIKVALKRDLEEWKKICDRNSKNGKSGGRPKTDGLIEEPKKPSGFSRNPKNPVKADNDIDTDRDNEKDISIHRLTIESVRESFSKQSINSLPHFHSLSKAFKLSLVRIEEHFEKWALASIDSMKDLIHCKRSFNLYLENIKRDELDDPNLPSNKYPKSTIKDNWF